jgi:hypothetical protein
VDFMGELQEEPLKIRINGSFVGAWLSLVERYVRDVEVAGSNPVAPIVEQGLLAEPLGLAMETRREPHLIVKGSCSRDLVRRRDACYARPSKSAVTTISTTSVPST